MGDGRMGDGRTGGRGRARAGGRLFCVRPSSWPALHQACLVSSPHRRSDGRQSCCATRKCVSRATDAAAAAAVGAVGVKRTTLEAASVEYVVVMMMMMMLIIIMKGHHNREFLLRAQCLRHRRYLNTSLNCRSHNRTMQRWRLFDLHQSVEHQFQTYGAWRETHARARGKG